MNTQEWEERADLHWKVASEKLAEIKRICDQSEDAKTSYVYTGAKHRYLKGAIHSLWAAFSARGQALEEASEQRLKRFEEIEARLAALENKQ